MGILDRYLLRLYTKILLIAFISLTGLYIVIHAFTNLDDFLAYGRESGGLAPVLAQFYGPRALAFLDRISGLLGMVAAVFAISWLRKNNELTALMANGVRRSRAARPLLLATLAVSLLGVANREWVLPRFRSDLLRNAQNWRGDRPQPLNPRYDHRNRILLSGQASLASTRTIIQPRFRLPTELRSFGRQLAAASAVYLEPAEGRPGGYLLIQVESPEDLDRYASARVDGEWALLTSRDTPWLQPDQCFVVSDVNFDQLAEGRAWCQFSSTGQLISAIRNPSLDYGADALVIIHSRLAQPLLDITLVFLGIPLVLRRRQRNLFMAAGHGMLLLAVFHIVVLVCHTLGGNGYLLSPSLAAWAPLMVFVPLAATLGRHGWE